MGYRAAVGYRAAEGYHAGCDCGVPHVRVVRRRLHHVDIPTLAPPLCLLSDCCREYYEYSRTPVRAAARQRRSLSLPSGPPLNLL
jgi:hypothetical protein